MDKHILYAALDHIGQRHTQAAPDLTAAVMARARRRAPLPLRLLRGPARAAAALLVGFLLVATTVYAVTRWQVDDPALSESMVTPLNLTQTRGDLTVSLDWAYADANRIVVAYTFATESGQLSPDQVTGVTLLDDQGRAFTPVRAFGADTSIPDMLTGNAHFDASGITGQPDSLDLRLRVRGDFAFDFTVPFIPGVRIGPQPDVTVSGLRANIESATITPSMTRVHYCYEAPEGETWYAAARLAFDGQRVALEAGASYPDFAGPQRRDDGRWCRTDYFLVAYDALPRQITLTIPALYTRHRYSEANMQRAAEVLAEYGIAAQVIRNEAQTEESYMLTIPDPPDDADLMARAWDDAMSSIGEPLEGERIDGPWSLTASVP